VRLVGFAPVNESQHRTPQGLSSADLGIRGHLWTENVTALSLAGAQSPIGAHGAHPSVSACGIGFEHRCIVSPNVPLPSVHAGRGGVPSRAEYFGELAEFALPTHYRPARPLLVMHGIEGQNHAHAPSARIQIDRPSLPLTLRGRRSQTQSRRRRAAKRCALPPRDWARLGSA
jgi:hypothetical protein